MSGYLERLAALEDAIRDAERVCSGAALIGAQTEAEHEAVLTIRAGLEMLRRQARSLALQAGAEERPGVIHAKQLRPVPAPPEVVA